MKTNFLWVLLLGTTFTFFVTSLSLWAEVIRHITIKDDAQCLDQPYGKVMLNLKKHEKVKLEEKEKYWFHISFQGKKCWIHGENMVVTDQEDHSYSSQESEQSVHFPTKKFFPALSSTTPLTFTSRPNPYVIKINEVIYFNCGQVENVYLLNVKKSHICMLVPNPNHDIEYKLGVNFTLQGMPVANNCPDVFKKASPCLLHLMRKF